MSCSILSFLDPSFGQYLSKTHLAEKLGAMMLRRRKAEVRAELPPVILQDLTLDLLAPQREKYDELWANRAATVGAAVAGKDISAALLGLITRLKIVCNFDAAANASAKLDALKTINEGAGESARILVFSQFVETLRWIADRIELPHDLLTGSMSLAERQVAIDRFKTESAPRYLLASLRAGGVD